jgi:hypothetical protein
VFVTPASFLSLRYPPHQGNNTGRGLIGIYDVVGKFTLFNRLFAIPLPSKGRKQPLAFSGAQTTVQLVPLVQFPFI